jgi:hypothetical protein
LAMLAPQLGSLEEEDARPPFDFDRSVELASLAFHSYMPVTGGKLERGSDQTNVAFQQANFVSECYDGVLVVTLDRIRGLPRQVRRCHCPLSPAQASGVAPVGHASRCCDAPLP